MGAGAFGLPGWYGGGIETIPETGDESTDNELSKREGRTLENSADDHDACSHEDGLATTEDVTNPDTANSA